MIMVPKWGRKFNHNRGFYRGEKLASVYPYGSYLTSKNWHLNEGLRYFKNTMSKLLGFHRTSTTSALAPKCFIYLDN